MLHISYLYRIHTVTFLPFRAYNTDNQLIINTIECSGLTSIYVYAEKVPKIGSDVFKEVDAKKCTLYVPMETYDAYWLSDFGYFENIVEFEATGIDKTITSTDVEEVARYSVNGQRLSAPTKGLNIVKYSDGSVKKVAVR